MRWVFLYHKLTLFKPINYDLTVITTSITTNKYGDVNIGWMRIEMWCIRTSGMFLFCIISFTIVMINVQIDLSYWRLRVRKPSPSPSPGWTGARDASTCLEPQVCLSSIFFYYINMFLTENWRIEKIGNSRRRSFAGDGYCISPCSATRDSYLRMGLLDPLKAR